MKDKGQKMKRDVMIVGAGGGLTLALLLIILVTVGLVSGGEARSLLEAILPTTRFFASTVITATATVLALMLTLLSLTAESDVPWKEDHFIRIRRIALMATIAMISATAVLCLHSVPLTESANAEAIWYLAFYYVLLGSAAVLGGLIVAVVLMLYLAVADMIKVVGFGEHEDSRMVDNEALEEQRNDTDQENRRQHREQDEREQKGQRPDHRR